MTRSRRSGSGAARRRSGNGWAWKSTLLAGCLGAVLWGWGLLASQDTAQNAVALAQDVQPRVVIVRVPIAAGPISGDSPPNRPAGTAPQTLNAASRAAASRVVLPPLPRKPIFQRPITRTRRS